MVWHGADIAPRRILPARMNAYLDALVNGGDYGAALADEVTFTITEEVVVEAMSVFLWICR
jgi:hypothetical protein